MTQTNAVAILPLDDRPPNYDFPALLAEAGDVTAKLPPKLWLGNPWRNGDIARLSTWLGDVAPTVDALIVALDTLGYGGLVNSRRTPDTIDTVLERLSLLKQLKAQHPSLTILGFSILMRISRHNSAEEEKPYWAEYGERIFRISYLEDRLSMLAGRPGDEDELLRLTSQVPPDILQDYRAGRHRNHTINRAMVEWTAGGLFDYLIIPQDDTVEYGWNIDERRSLQMLVHQRALAGRVSIYPGADETAMLLLARHLAMLDDFRPKVWTRYSSVKGGQTITAYEDRPMEEMVKAHLGPLGGMLASSPETADINLYVNSPAKIQGDGSQQYLVTLDDAALETLPPRVTEVIQIERTRPDLQPTLQELHSVARNVQEFARSLSADLDADRPCAVVDVAYVNGADLALASALRRRVNLAQLDGYGGWNTAGNTLGTVLAHAVIRRLQERRGASEAALAAHLRFLFLRLVDDYLYQALVRAQTALCVLPMQDMPPSMSDLGEKTEPVRQQIAERLRTEADQLADQHFNGQRLSTRNAAVHIDKISISDVYLPWHRLFEVGFEVEISSDTPADIQPS